MAPIPVVPVAPSPASPPPISPAVPVVATSAPSFGPHDAPTAPGIAPTATVGVSGGDDIDDLLAAPAGAEESGPRSDMETVVGDVPTDDIEELDMEEADVVEITDDEAQQGAQATSAPLDVDIDFDDEPADESFEDEDEPPASSRRAKAELDIVGGSMDEALASAAELDEREPPLKTPPPESGRQVAAPAIPPQPGAPDIHEFDLVAARPRPPMPTMEQLGSTVDLAGADAPDAELELAVVPDLPVPEQDELEAPIPSGPPAATYDDSLVPPPEARDELDARRAAELERSAPPPAVAISAPLPRVAEALTPDVTPRPPIVGQPADFVVSPRPDTATTFLQILDASLAL